MGEVIKFPDRYIRDLKQIKTKQYNPRTYAGLCLADWLKYCLSEKRRLADPSVPHMSEVDIESEFVKTLSESRIHTIDGFYELQMMGGKPINIEERDLWYIDSRIALFEKPSCVPLGRYVRSREFLRGW